MDYRKLYKTNENFRIFVDKASKADKIPVEEELTKAVVRNVGDYYAENNKVVVSKSMITAGCGGANEQ